MTLVLPETSALPAAVRDSLDEALLVRFLAPDAAGLRDAGRAAFSTALRACWWHRAAVAGDGVLIARRAQ